MTRKSGKSAALTVVTWIGRISLTIIFVPLGFFIWPSLGPLLTTKDWPDPASVVADLTMSKFRGFYWLMVVLDIVLLLAITARYFVSRALFPVSLLLGLGGLMLLLAINYFVFLYRVRAGFFGTNLREAREIVQFIESGRTNNWNGPSGPRRIYEKPARARQQAGAVGPEGVTSAS